MRSVPQPRRPVSAAPGDSDLAGVPLSELRPGERGRLAAVRLTGEQADHVRALGLHESCDLRICRSAGTCIVQVMGGGGPGCRIALDRDLAREVMVTPLTRNGRPVDPV